MKRKTIYIYVYTPTVLSDTCETALSDPQTLILYK